MAFAIHKFFNDRGFYYWNSPLITASDCEGAGAMFQVTTLDLNNPPRTEDGRIDYSQDFFGKPCNLTVSGQLEGELGALSLGRIYTFGPTFRAENSNTPRHLSEFWMIEPEMAFYELEDNMELAEEFLKYLIGYALENCREDLEFMCKMWDKELIERLEFVLHNDFKRLDYTEGIEILKASGRKFEFPCDWGCDLQSEHERYLVEEHFKRPVILVNYPKEIKAFYMKQNDDGRTVRAMDVLFPKIGEIIGGSEREADYGKLCARIKELNMNERFRTRLRASAPLRYGHGQYPRRDTFPPYPAARRILGAAARRPKIGHTGCAEGVRRLPSSCALILILSTHGYSSETGDDASAEALPAADPND